MWIWATYKLLKKQTGPTPDVAYTSMRAQGAMCVLRRLKLMQANDLIATEGVIKACSRKYYVLRV